MARRATTVCSQPGCPNLTPCADHPKPEGPWVNSTRRERVGKSGWQQQRDAQRILRKHRGICHVCHQPGADEVDHVIPTTQGGSDDDSNKRPIHAEPCHRLKTAREAAEGRRRTYPA